MLEQIKKAAKTFFVKMHAGGLAKSCTIFKVEDSYDPEQGIVTPINSEIASTLIILRDLTVKEKSDMAKLGFTITQDTKKGVLLMDEIDPGVLANGDKIVAGGEEYSYTGITAQNPATFEILLRP